MSLEVFIRRVVCSVAVCAQDLAYHEPSRMNSTPALIGQLRPELYSSAQEYCPCVPRTFRQCYLRDGVQACSDSGCTSSFPAFFFFHIHLTSLAIMTADQLMLFLESQLHWKTKVSYRSCCVNTCGLQQVSEC